MFHRIEPKIKLQDYFESIGISLLCSTKEKRKKYCEESSEIANIRKRLREKRIKESWKNLFLTTLDVNVNNYLEFQYYIENVTSEYFLKHNLIFERIYFQHALYLSNDDLFCSLNRMIDIMFDICLQKDMIIDNEKITVYLPFKLAKGFIVFLETKIYDLLVSKSSLSEKEKKNTIAYFD